MKFMFFIIQDTIFPKHDTSLVLTIYKTDTLQSVNRADSVCFTMHVQTSVTLQLLACSGKTEYLSESVGCEVLVLRSISTSDQLVPAILDRGHGYKTRFDIQDRFLFGMIGDFFSE